MFRAYMPYTEIYKKENGVLILVMHLEVAKWFMQNHPNIKVSRLKSYRSLYRAYIPKNYRGKLF